MSPREWRIVEIPSDFDEIPGVAEAVLALLEDMCYCEDCIFAVKLALEEAIVNAIRHGNRMDRDLMVLVRYCVSPQCVVIEVTDRGVGFDPSDVPDPTTDENLGRPDGRGIMLIRAYMDEVTFSSNGSVVTLVKYNV
jgi:serine/threonine-protein kinase RsbW